MFFKTIINYFRGFVSVVVGSDLKWWKINPCDTTNKRNMFQSLHRCDAETTVVSNYKIKISRKK